MNQAYAGLAGAKDYAVGQEASLARREPQTSRELGELERNIEITLKCVHDLVSRLDPISRASAPTNQAGKVREAEAIAPMAERMRKGSEALTHICYILTDAKERLEV